MKKFISGFFFMLAMCYSLSAQEILNGYVYDIDTKEPIPGASVYLDGTSYRTTADNYGRFELSIPQKIRSSLVVVHLAYQPLVVSNPFDNINALNKLYMIPAIGEVGKVLVSDKRLYSQSDLMRAFKEEFLGVTPAGLSCSIENEYDISLDYDIDNGILTAKCFKPIIINNPYLKYTMEFVLTEFQAKYIPGTYQVNTTTIIGSHFYGTSFFIDNNSNSSAEIEDRRAETYQNSPIYFFKNLLNGTTADAKMKLFDRGHYPINTDIAFEITTNDSSSKLLSIHKVYQIPIEERHDSDICFYMFVQNRRKSNESIIAFRSDKLLFDNNGLIHNPKLIFYMGRYAAMKAGDMLPIEYE